MPPTDSEEALEALRKEFRRRLDEIDNRCVQRGETMARNAEHRRQVNGDIQEIKQTQKEIKQLLIDTREDFAGWKGRVGPLIAVSSAFIGAVCAAAWTWLQSHLTGGTP